MEGFTKKKKIIHLLAEIKFSGAEVMLNLAAPYFAEKNVELYAMAVGSEVGDYANVLKESGFKIYHIHRTNFFAEFCQIYKFFRKNKFDVIHMHFEGAFFWFLLAVWLAGQKTIVRTVHSVFPYKGYLRFRRSLQRYLATNLMGVKFLSISPSVVKVEKEVLRNKSTLVPNWINASLFEPLKDEFEKLEARNFIGIPQDSFVIITVGSSTTVKNHRDVLTATAQLVKKYPNICYLHVGDGPLQPELKSYALQLGINNNVIFAGQLKNVRQGLVAADVFVMTSIYEGLGNSLLEAMTFGLPSVVYNSAGLIDLVVHNENGFVTEKNPESLEKAIQELLQTPTKRFLFGKAARAEVLEKYDMKKSLDKLMKVYFPNIEESASELVNV